MISGLVANIRTFRQYKKDIILVLVQGPVGALPQMILKHRCLYKEIHKEVWETLPHIAQNLYYCMY